MLLLSCHRHQGATAPTMEKMKWTGKQPGSPSYRGSRARLGCCANIPHSEECHTRGSSVPSAGNNAPRFHRARLGGTTTGQLHSGRHRHVSTELASVVRQLVCYTAGRIPTFPPSSPRWYDSWSATQRPASPRFHRARLGGTIAGQLRSGRHRHVSTELASVVRQLVSYAAAGIATFPPSSPRWYDSWSATQRPASPRFHRACLGGTTTGLLRSGWHPRVSTELASVVRQLACYAAAGIATFPPSSPRWCDNWSATQRHASPRFHRARLGGTITGQLRSGWHRHVSTELASVVRQLACYAAARIPTFPPSLSRWYDSWSATQRPASPRFHRARLGGATTGLLRSGWHPRVSTELASVVRQLACYAAAGIPTFPPSSSRWCDNWSATQRPASPRFHRACLGGTIAGQLRSGRHRHVSTELASVVRQLACYAAARIPTFPPSLSRWYDSWSATQRPASPRFHRARLGGTTTGLLRSGAHPHVSTELASVVRQLACYAAGRIPTFPPSLSRWYDSWSATQRRASPRFH